MVVSAHRGPGLSGDTQDDRRDGQADEWVSNRQADGNHGRRRDDGERHVGVSAGVGAVGDERRAIETPPGAGANNGTQVIGGKAHDACGGQGDEVIRCGGVD